MRYLTVTLLCLAMISTLGADTSTDSDSADVTLSIEQYCYIEFDEDDTESNPLDGRTDGVDGGDARFDLTIDPATPLYDPFSLGLPGMMAWDVERFKANANFGYRVDGVLTIPPGAPGVVYTGGGTIPPKGWATIYDVDSVTFGNQTLWPATPLTGVAGDYVNPYVAVAVWGIDLTDAAESYPGGDLTITISEQ